MIVLLVIVTFVVVLVVKIEKNRKVAIAKTQEHFYSYISPTNAARTVDVDAIGVPRISTYYEGTASTMDAPRANIDDDGYVAYYTVDDVDAETSTRIVMVENEAYGHESTTSGDVPGTGVGMSMVVNEAYGSFENSDRSDVDAASIDTGIDIDAGNCENTRICEDAEISMGMNEAYGSSPCIDSSGAARANIDANAASLGGDEFVCGVEVDGRAEQDNAGLGGRGDAGSR